MAVFLFFQDGKKEDNSDDAMDVDDPGPSVSKENSLNPTPVPTPIASEDETKDDVRDDAMSMTSNEGVETAKVLNLKS